MILYILDALVILVILGSKLFPNSFVLYSSIYLILKGALFTFFSKDIASVIDTICGIYLLAVFLNFGIYFFTTLCVIWLLQKLAVFFILRIAG